MHVKITQKRVNAEFIALVKTNHKIFRENINTLVRRIKKLKFAFSAHFILRCDLPLLHHPNASEKVTMRLLKR